MHEGSAKWETKTSVFSEEKPSPGNCWTVFERGWTLPGMIEQDAVRARQSSKKC